jgi:hypothetical protein
MSGLHNLKLRRSPLGNHDLHSVSRRSTRELIRLNRRIDPKFGFEQWIVAREIALGRYVDGDRFQYNELPERLFCRLPDPTIQCWLHDGTIRLDTFARDPQINASDIPDTPEAPYILAQHGRTTIPGLPIALGQRALVLRTFLDPYVHIGRHRHCIAIDDPDGFVNCITRRLAEVLQQVDCQIVRRLHAPCVYQWSRLIGTRRVQDNETGLVKDGYGDDGNAFLDKADRWSNPEDAKYFIKPGYGFHDAEFRFVWILDQDFEGYVDLRCPDLLSYVSVFSDPHP